MAKNEARLPILEDQLLGWLQFSLFVIEADINAPRQRAPISVDDHL